MTDGTIMVGCTPSPVHGVPTAGSNVLLDLRPGLSSSILIKAAHTLEFVLVAGDQAPYRQVAVGHCLQLKRSAYALSSKGITVNQRLTGTAIGDVGQLRKRPSVTPSP